MSEELEKPKGIIYKITSPSGKIYIGQTDRSFNLRWKQHKSKSSCCTALHRAILKYGEENMTKQILCECDVEELKVKENEFIKEFNSLAPYGYNLKMNDDTGRTVFSEETKKRISEGNKKYAKENPRTLTEEQKEHLRQINTGKVMSEESKQKMRDSKKNKKGTLHTSESKKQISNSLKEYYKNLNTPRTQVIDENNIPKHFKSIEIKNNVETKTFMNQTEAGKYLNCSAATVRRHIDKVYNGYEIKRI